MKHKHKTLILSGVLILILTLLLSSCGGGNAADDDDSKNGGATVAAGATLWDKKVSFELTDIPIKNADEDSYLAVALTPDGSKVLISGLYHTPYLSDLSNGSQTNVSCANKTTRITMENQYMLSSLSALKSAEQKEAFKENNKDLDQLSDAEMTDKYFSAMPGFRLLAMTNTVPSKEPYLIVYDNQRGSSGALNVNTGALSLLEKGTCYGIRDGKMVARADKQNALTLFDCGTGEAAETVSFTFAAVEGYSFIDTAVVLPDGSLAAIVLTYGADSVSDMNVTVGIVHKDGQKTAYELGMLQSSCVPHKIFSADGQNLILGGSSARSPLILLDAQGNKSALGISDNKLTVNDFADCTDEEGRLSLPEEQESFFALAPLCDGETLLCANMDGTPLLLRPQTQQLQLLFNGKDAAIPAFATAYTGNGYDKWLILDSMTMKNQLITLTVR